MAINDETNQQRTQQQSTTSQAAPAGATEGNRFWSFHQQNVTNSPVAAGVGGEYLTKMRTLVLEMYKEIAEGMEVTTLTLNRLNYPALKFSALVVACRIPQSGKDIIAFHTLVLEATGERLAPVMRTIDNQPIQVNRVTSDAYDDVLYKMAFEAVSTEFPDATVYSADAMVVPSSVTVDRKDLVEYIARNAAMACVSVINQASGSFGELNLAYMDKDCRFVVDVAFGNHQVTDVTGAPQRSSVLIQYSSQKKSASSNMSIDTVNAADPVARICELSGFMNAIWAPVDPQNSFGFGAYTNPNIPRATQKFAAEFVVTSVKTEYATSPAAVLLALSSFLALVDNDAWIQAFLPKGAQRSSAGKIDITDIGALNVTANLGDAPGGFGAPIDMTPLIGDPMEFNKYLVSIFRPGVVISLDCPESGPQSWYLSVFAAAASGDTNAYNQIFAAAQELANNQFERYFKHGDAMFTNIVRVPLGTYPAGDKLQDIRNIDYAAIANRFGTNDPQVIHEYSNTFVERPGASAVRNLAIREGIYRDALDQQATITGYAARVSLSDLFVKGLSAAIADCALPVTVNTPMNVDMMRAGTPTPGFIGASLAHGTRTYSTGYTQTRNAPQYRYGGYR